MKAGPKMKAGRSKKLDPEGHGGLFGGEHAWCKPPRERGNPPVPAQGNTLYLAPGGRESRGDELGAASGRGS